MSSTKTRHLPLILGSLLILLGFVIADGAYPVSPVPFVNLAAGSLLLVIGVYLDIRGRSGGKGGGLL